MIAFPEMLQAVETALDTPLTGFAAPMASYINRVYELEGVDRKRYVAKFYRPGRWGKAALLQEHAFVAACAQDDVPVISPLPLQHGSTLGESVSGVFFAVYPKEWGRALELNTLDDYRKLGSLLARVHLAGEGVNAPDRWRYTPETATVPAVNRLLRKENFPDPQWRRAFRDVAFPLLDTLLKSWRNLPEIVLHGDCHAGNILMRPDSGLLVIDFDDMLRGCAMQDLWLLLPDFPENCPDELAAVLQGYRLLRELPEEELSMIELLRSMRMIYFLDWCAMQRNDCKFSELYPQWGTAGFWRNEIEDLLQQHQRIKAVL